MCLELRKNQRVKIAKEDIVCYKILELFQTEWVSPYYGNFVWNTKVGVITTVPKFGHNINFFSELPVIEEGLHSFSTLGECLIMFDSFDTPVHPHKIHKFIIPKGTRYYEDTKNNEYVSLALVYVEKVKL